MGKGEKVGRGELGPAVGLRGRLARGSLELAAAGALLLVVLFLIGARLLAPPPPQGIFPNASRLAVCANSTGAVRFTVNVGNAYRSMYVSVLAPEDCLSVSYPPPGKPRSFDIYVTALRPGNFTLQVRIGLVGKSIVQKIYTLNVAVKNCTTSSGTT